MRTMPEQATSETQIMRRLRHICGSGSLKAHSIQSFQLLQHWQGVQAQTPYQRPDQRMPCCHQTLGPPDQRWECPLVRMTVPSAALFLHHLRPTPTGLIGRP